MVQALQQGKWAIVPDAERGRHESTIRDGLLKLERDPAVRKKLGQCPACHIMPYRLVDVRLGDPESVAVRCPVCGLADFLIITREPDPQASYRGEPLWVLRNT